MTTTTAEPTTPANPRTRAKRKDAGVPRTQKPATETKDLIALLGLATRRVPDLSEVNTASDITLLCFYGKAIVDAAERERVERIKALGGIVGSGTMS